MITLKEKYKDTFKHNYTQDILKEIKQIDINFFNEYFVEK